MRFVSHLAKFTADTRRPRLFERLSGLRVELGFVDCHPLGQRDVCVPIAMPLHILRARPKLIGSFDEASVVNWTGDNEERPSPAQAAEMMKKGRTSKLKYPSTPHAAGNSWPDEKVPFPWPRPSRSK